MRIKLPFFIGLCIYANIGFGQSKQAKQFSGNFENGTATYSYFENENYERIYNGSFIFNGIVKKYDGLKLSIIGNFSDNLRNGNWKFNVQSYKTPIIELITEKDLAMGQMALKLAYQIGSSPEKIAELKNKLKNKVVFEMYSSSLTGNYILGKLDGNWIFSESFTGGSSPIMGYTLYKSNNPIYSSVNFNENRLVGKFIYKQGLKYLIEGQFDDNGNPTGKWIIRWTNQNEEFENIREYVNGELKTMIERNTSTGDILFRDNRFDGEGLKIMLNAIYFWVATDKTLTVDDIVISERNYMFKFERGIVLPINPFQQKEVISSVTAIPSPNHRAKVLSNRPDSEGTGNYSLKGRIPQCLPLPEYNSQTEGTVVVEITVDNGGNVTQAVAGAKGTTTLDESLRRASEQAALKAKFDSRSDAPSSQKGTITYRFHLQ